MKIVRFRGRVVVLVAVCLIFLVALLRTVTFLSDFNSPPADDDPGHKSSQVVGGGVDTKYDGLVGFDDSLQQRGDVVDVELKKSAAIDGAVVGKPLTLPNAVVDDVTIKNRRGFHRVTSNAGASVAPPSEDFEQSRREALRRRMQGLNAAKIQSVNLPPGPPGDRSASVNFIPTYLNRPALGKAAAYPVLTPEGKFVPSRRIVHLDLKGAHPKFEFFKLFFPFLAQLGATGILVEYEEVFPYTGALAPFRSTTAYSDSELRQILLWARDSQLEVIPLVQTFGHLEWILKHEKYAQYREVERYAQVICLSNMDAVQLVKMIIDQVMQFHKDTSEFFHIGADEAFQVGQCSKCQETMKDQLKGSRERLMLRHIANVSSHVRETHSKRVLMWHDMLSNVDGQLVKEYKLDELVEPVVWAYAENLNEYLLSDFWLRFSSIFPYIWGASAFKGADGPSRYHSNVPHYLRNHLSWNDQMQREYKNFRQFRGLIMTGWQRFDHFAILCELLPVGVPSLVVGLLAVTHASYNKDVLRLASQAMQCSGQFEMEIPSYSSMPAGAAVNYCQFPGAKIYQLVQQCYNSQMSMHSQLLQDYQVKGWLSTFNVRHNYSSAWYLDQIVDKIYMHRAEMAQCSVQLRAELSVVFRDDAVDEFLYEHIQPDVKILDDLAEKARFIGKIRFFPLRPFPIRNFSAPLGVS